MNKLHSRLSLKANLLLFAAVVLICLIAAEVFLRVAWTGFSPGSSKKPVMAYDDTLGWIGKANYVGSLAEGNLSVPCRINDWGFRDEQPQPAEAVPGKRRLMFLGDSFIMGTGVEEEHRASEVTERLDSGVVSYNFGIFAYSTDQELLVLQKFGPQVQPNDVLLFFCMNDLIYNDSDLGHRVPKPHFRVDESGFLKLGNVPVPSFSKPNPVLTWLQGNLALGQIIHRVIGQLAFRGEVRQRRGGIDESVKERFDLDSLLIFSESTDTGGLTYLLLAEMRDFCRELGTNLVVFTTPSSHHWSTTREETPAEMQRVLNWCEELEIKAIDLFPVFYKDYAAHGERLYLPDQMHWNDRGNRIAGEAVVQYLKENPLPE